MSDLLTRLVVALEGIASGLANVPAPAEDKPKPAKAEAPKKETAKAKEPKKEPVKADPPAKKEPEFDYDLLKANVIKLATKFGSDGKARAIEILAGYGVTKADQADPDRWPEMNEKFETAIAEAESKKDDEDFA